MEVRWHMRHLFELGTVIRVTTARSRRYSECKGLASKSSDRADVVFIMASGIQLLEGWDGVRQLRL